MTLSDAQMLARLRALIATTPDRTGPRRALWQETEVNTRTFQAPATTAFEPMSVDSVAPAPGQRWRIYAALAIGQLATQPIVLPGGPSVGHFIVPKALTQNPNAAESVASASTGISRLVRGMAVPMQIQQIQLNPGGPFAFVALAVLYQPVYLTSDFVWRFLASVAPNTAQPGPGAGSACDLWLQFAIEQAQ